ncbi:MAG: hypothetical protein U0487_01935 [Patescibacteria group bacterium]
MWMLSVAVSMLLVLGIPELLDKIYRHFVASNPDCTGYEGSIMAEEGMCPPGLSVSPIRYCDSHTHQWTQPTCTQPELPGRYCTIDGGQLGYQFKTDTGAYSVCSPM